MLIRQTRLLKLLRVRHPMLGSQLLHILHGEFWQLSGGLDVGDVLVVAFGKDHVDFFEGAVRGFGVEEIAIPLVPAYVQ